MNKTVAIWNLALLSLFALSASPSLGASGSSPKVVVRPSASVNNDFITLGDIADITPSPLVSKASAQLAGTVVGRAPLAGATRFLTRGDIELKLRQAGIDPQSVDLEGVANITVSSGESAAPSSSSSGASDSANQSPSSTVTVKPGEVVDIVLVDGPVVVHAKGTAITGGRSGDSISVRRDEAMHPLTATIIAAGQVQLEE